MLDSERCARKKETALEKKKGKSTIILLTLILSFQCINSTYKTFPSIPFILKLIIRSNIWNAERTTFEKVEKSILATLTKGNNNL